MSLCTQSVLYQGKDCPPWPPCLFHGNKVPAGHVVLQLDSMFPRLPAPHCGHMFRSMESESVPFQKDASLSPGLLLFPWLDEEGVWGSCPGLTGGSPMLWMAEPRTSSQTICLLESKTNLTCLSPVFWNVCYSGLVGMLQLKLFRAKLPLESTG